ncbi:hypothetical protein HWV03_05610 [Moritella sp. 36]|uniref:outer membrane beta-barrel protein n=1 Tax=Moritella sp. 36 TaxID=2746233 RepID=UPI001BA470BD|nr:outer membrane beta-barrel protein [Moritella sp. 36]QUM88332.1 hypothetical protein HWV03_05610 [Moritella sp. 36]
MKLIYLYFTLATLFSSAAFANNNYTPVSYRYYQLNYTEVVAENADDPLKTYQINISNLISPYIFSRTSFNYLSKETIIDAQNSMTTTSMQAVFNMGTRLALLPKIDLTIESGAIYEFGKEIELKSNSVSATNDDFDREFGFNAAVGLAMQFSHQLEFIIDAAYIDIGDESEMEYSAELVAHLLPNLALVASGVMYEESSGFGFGLQFDF